MNDENNEFVNTEEPLEVSEELLKELMEASARIDRGEGLVSHEEMKAYAQQLIEEYDNLSLTEGHIVINEKEKVRTVNEL